MNTPASEAAALMSMKWNKPVRLSDALPGREQRQGDDGEGEHEHDEAQPVGGQVEADARLGDPGDVQVIDEGARGADHAGAARRPEVPRPQRHRQPEACQRSGQGHPAARRDAPA